MCGAMCETSRGKVQNVRADSSACSLPRNVAREKRGSASRQAGGETLPFAGALCSDDARFVATSRTTAIISGTA